MADTLSLNDWNTDPTLNSNIAGTDISVGMPPQDVGVFIRTAMAQIAYAVQGADGPIPATWHVTQLIADNIPITNPGTTGTQAVNFSQFAPTAAFSGHIDLPGGVTLNWGNGTVSAIQTVTFSKTFSTTPWCVLMTAKDAPNSGPPVPIGLQTTTVVTNAGFNLICFNTITGGFAAANFFWFAIGPT